LEDTFGDVGDSGMFDTVYIWSKGVKESGPSYIPSNEESLKNLGQPLVRKVATVS